MAREKEVPTRKTTTEHSFSYEGADGIKLS